MKSILLCLFLATACARPAERTDVGGPRVVSLIPNATEIIFDLGLGDHLVGATRYCDRPAAARRIPRVGGILDVSSEAVLATRPDLVIGSPKVLRGHLADLLSKAGADTLVLDFDTAESVVPGIRALGRALNRGERADRLVRTLEKDFDDLRDRARTNPPVKVLFVAGRNPLVVASRASFIGDLLERMGVENVVTAQRIPYPTWSLEQMLRADPDVLLDGAVEAGDLEGSMAAGGIRAAREGRVLSFADHALLRPGPAAVRAALKLADDILVSAGR
ncbi:MAG: ABC transporter substrate-binding protein [Deltaproteobacteria bacterium]|nr:ABC transporter substrate-binding protein [Deltaproteobacteria bacterium]